VARAYWRRTYVSFATDDPAGFREEHVARVRALLPAIAARVSLEASKETARQLLRAYLGANATRRILGGAFERGGAETLRAVLWYCDMRGFTTLSDVRPAHEVVRVLDAYFDAVASPIDARGGEVLKFIGDAVLAIFPLDPDPHDACRRALAAVDDTRANLARLNAARAARGEDALGLGLALHAGDVSYGNIGAQNRLDFTVIGAPVNEVCRVEAMTRTLGVDVLLTATFVALAGLAEAVPMGAHRLKGVGAPVELYTMPR
jgi:adenylate cyclase